MQAIATPIEFMRTDFKFMDIILIVISSEWVKFLTCRCIRKPGEQTVVTFQAQFFNSPAVTLVLL